MNIAYLINVYPRPNQTFIWREMAALEAGGINVHRFALRPCDEALDGIGLGETRRTRYVLGGGKLGIVMAGLRTMLSRPGRGLAAWGAAWRCGRRSQRGLVRHFLYWAEACVLARWMKECGAEHAHAHYGTNTAAILMLCRLLGGPTYSFTAHGPEEFDSPIALSLGEKIKHAAFVVAVCNYGRSQLYRWCPRQQWHKVQIVRCGVDELFLSGPRHALPAAPRLLSVGRLSEQKGQFLLVEAAALLKDRGIEFELVLVGDGELRGPIEELIQSRQLGASVKLAGWKSAAEIRGLMLESRALVMPSFAEGLPVVVMESLALGRPVLSTYVAGIPELVQNGVSGVLVPASDVKALADAMAGLLSAGNDELERLGENGRQRVRADHDAATEAARLAGLFRRAVTHGLAGAEESVEQSSASAAPAEGATAI
jgi:colanic acid/amylovoran biosynthesis glycosyltransferase